MSYRVQKPVEESLLHSPLPQKRLTMIVSLRPTEKILDIQTTVRTARTMLPSKFLQSIFQKH